MTSAPGPLLLASTSRYRCELLSRLRLPFETRSPEVDETPVPGEAPATLAARLAEAKAMAVQALDPRAWIIGSDQVAELEGRALGKPGTIEAAFTQLRAMSGHQVTFHTAACLLGPDRRATVIDITRVKLRALADEDIHRYLAAEPATDCAGSFKAEGLGIALFDAIVSRDPTALVGLPLIATARLLREAGFAVP